MLAARHTHNMAVLDSCRRLLTGCDAPGWQAEGLPRPGGVRRRTRAGHPQRLDAGTASRLGQRNVMIRTGKPLIGVMEVPEKLQAFTSTWPAEATRLG